MTEGAPGQRPRVTLERSERLSDSARITELFDRGALAKDGLMVLRALPGPAAGCRLCVIAGKRYGNAVKRNRAKRRLRAAFRQVKDRMPSGLDVLVLPRYRLPDASFEKLTKALLRLAGTAAKACRGREGEERRPG